MKKHWTTDELEILKKYYQNYPIEKILELLPNRSKDAIQWKASQLGYLIRDGKQKQASYKMIVNLTKEHYEFLNSKRNHSRIVRNALDMFIKSENTSLKLNI